MLCGEERVCSPFLREGCLLLLTELRTFYLSPWAGDLYVDKVHAFPKLGNRPDVWGLHFLLVQELILCLLHSKLPAGHRTCHFEDILSHTCHRTSVSSDLSWVRTTYYIFP